MILKVVKMVQYYLIYVILNVLNDIECIFKKSGIYNYLFFCESNKNKDIINNYVKIIDQINYEITSWKKTIHLG